MTGSAAQVEHWTGQIDQMPPHDGQVVLMLMRPVADQADVLP